MGGGIGGGGRRKKYMQDLNKAYKAEKSTSPVGSSVWPLLKLGDENKPVQFVTKPRYEEGWLREVGVWSPRRALSSHFRGLSKVNTYP